MLIELAWEAQIAQLLAKKVIILAKYLNFADIFLKELSTKLLKCLDINKHWIDLKPDKQPVYNSIYSLRLLEQKILKTYIEINQAKDFISLFKLITEVSVLFIQKLDSSFYLYIDYQGQNNLIIKKQ